LQNRVDKLNQSHNDLQNRVDKLNQSHNNLQNRVDELNWKIKSNTNWIRLFGIYNSKENITIIFFGIKLTIKVNEETVNKLAWWIPVRKWRDNFRDKFNGML
ncbi:coenzyme F420 hydrogenase, partial [Brachyspira intermedia]